MGSLFRYFCLLFMCMAIIQSSLAARQYFDVVVYDASSGGVTAAVAAARAGHSVGLLCASWPACFPEGGKVVGGMSSSGLGQSDIGSDPEITIGGLALEFYERNRKNYGATNRADSTCRLPSECNVTYNLEPHVAQGIFQDMIKEEPLIQVFFAAAVSRVVVREKKIISIATTSNHHITAAVFIDASYEGDLMALAGVSFTTGRESRSTYGEPLGGITVGARSNQFSVAISPFNATTGALLPLVQELPEGNPGEADNRIQAYNFRLCVTKNATRRASFPKPPNYDPEKYEIFRRYLIACQGKASCQLGFPSCNTARVPNAKFDSNNCGGISSDFIGMSDNYRE